jgi:hypothetical protein
MEDVCKLHHKDDYFETPVWGKNNSSFVEYILLEILD